MLTKAIDGEVIVMSAEEEAAVRAMWATFLTKTPGELVAYANKAQWAKAVSGIVFVDIEGAAVPFQTTEASYSLIMGTILDMQMPDGPTEVNWQIGPTNFMSIHKDDLVRAGRAVKAHIQATFDALPAILASIGSGTFTTEAQIDAALDQVAPAGA